MKAILVRRISPGERILELINSVKAYTWEKNAEHAVVSLEKSDHNRVERIIVSGDCKAIEFVEDEGKLFVEIEGQLVQIKRVIAHTHPLVTGPSQADVEVLDKLGQSRSYVFEIGGQPGGTLIRPKKWLS